MNIRPFSGQSLFEVTIALGVIALILVGIVPLAITSVRNASFSNNNAQATKYVQEAVEWLRQERDGDWDNFVQKGNQENYCLRQTNWNSSGFCGPTDFIPGTAFLREVNLVCYENVPSNSRQCIGGDPSVNGVKAEVRVRWTDGQKTHEVKSVNYFTSWRR